MGLIKKVPVVDNKKRDTDIINKSKNLITVGATVKGGKNVLDTINTLSAYVNTKLGKYKDKYKVLRTEAEIEDYFNLIQSNGTAALDTETSGLNPMLDDLAGICLYTPGEKAVYIPYGHISYITGSRVANQPTKEFLYKCFFNLRGIKWIMHNAKFDIRVIRNHIGIKLYAYWDTMLASRCIDENESAALKTLHLKYCNSTDDEAYTYEKLFDGLSFTLVPVNVAYLYAAGDAIKTFELYEYQQTVLNRRKLPGQYSVFMNIEMPLIDVVVDMEDTGITLDIEYAKKLSEKYHTILDEQVATVHSIINNYSKQIEAYKKANPDNKLSDPINVGSPAQIAILLYDVLRLTSPDKKSPRGTGEEILTVLNHPLSKAILDYRGTVKLLSTYIDKLPEMVNPNTGRLHGSFNQYGARTGRFSSSDPNLQNIPSHNKEIRKMFCAKDGYVLVGADFSQQEPRTLAHISGDENLIGAYAEGKDIYSWVASLVYDVPYDECREFRPDGTVNPEGKERRSFCKSIVLGLMYSRGDKSVAEQLGVSVDEAKKLTRKFFDAFPHVEDFIKSTEQFASEHGYVTTAWGRVRHLPNMLLKPYEFKYVNGNSPNFNPLSFNDAVVDEIVPQSVVDKYTSMLQKTFSSKGKSKIRELLATQGIEIKDNTLKITDASRQCVNSIIQGTSADMSKTAMIHVHNDALLKEWGFQILLQVHDEVIGECPIENAKKVADRLSMIMIDSAKDKISVPMKCDSEITKCWYGDPVEV